MDRARTAIRSASRRVLTAPASWVLLGAALCPLPSPQTHQLLGLPTLCIFQRVLGISCPGCGLTRGLVCFVHGELGAALHYHPLAPLVGLCLMLSLGARFLGRTVSTALATRVAIVLLVLSAVVVVLRAFGVVATPE